MGQFYDICLVWRSMTEPRNCSVNKCLLCNDKQGTHLLVVESTAQGSISGPSSVRLPARVALQATKAPSIIWLHEITNLYYISTHKQWNWLDCRQKQEMFLFVTAPSPFWDSPKFLLSAYRLRNSRSKFKIVHSHNAHPQPSITFTETLFEHNMKKILFFKTCLSRKYWTWRL